MVQGREKTPSEPARITCLQFEAVAKLLRGRDPAKTAAKMVLLDAMAVKDVVLATGMSQPAVSQAAGRYREAHELLLSAYGDGSGSGVQNGKID